MFTKFKTINKRALYGTGAVIIALSLIITGAFSWFDNSQHKTNIATGGNKIVKDDVVLIEDFEEPPDWGQDDELKKEVSVKNTGDGQIFVRLQLKEYMDIATVEYKRTTERLLVDKDGKFMSWTNEAAAKSWLTINGIPFTNAQLVRYIAHGDTTSRIYFATDQNTPLNGRDGKHMLLNYTQNAPLSLIPGVKRAIYSDTDDHRLHPTEECKYTPHLWNGSTFEGGKDTNPNKDPFHEYVAWKLGAPQSNLIKMSVWDGQPVAAWILDDGSDEGWAYWGEALKPGDSTTKILESIKLIKQPDGPFYYAVHVDMQAADTFDLDKVFDKMPKLVKDSYHSKIGFVIDPNTVSISQGGVVNFNAYWNGTQLVPANVNWTVSKGTASGVSAQTTFNNPGVLSIGSAQPTGSLIVTASYNSPMGQKSAKYVIMVK